MPIEFPCPYCKATIRVPDNAGGGKGRCPKCATKITVPKKSPKKAVARTEDDDEPFVLPLADEELTGVGNDSAINEHGETPALLDAAPISFDPANLTKPRLGELPVERSGSQPSIAQRLKKKERRNGSWKVALAIGILGIIGAGYFMLPQLLTERLTGEVTAETAATLELPSAVFDKSRLRLSPEDVARLLLKLEQNPVPLNSNSMSMLIAGSDKGLSISLAAGTTTQFYRVSLKENDAIAKFLGRRLAELEEIRSQRLDQAANDFLAEYEKVLAKKSPSDAITPFRDSLGLTSLVRGLGHELVAESGGGLYRCVYQDKDDHLYFLLPPGLTDFRIVGFKHPDGTVVVPAELNVKVKGQIHQEKSTKEKKVPVKSSAEKEDAAPDEDMPKEANTGTK